MVVARAAGGSAFDVTPDECGGAPARLQRRFPPLFGAASAAGVIGEEKDGASWLRIGSLSRVVRDLLRHLVWWAAELHGARLSQGCVGPYGPVLGFLDRRSVTPLLGCDT